MNSQFYPYAIIITFYIFYYLVLYLLKSRKRKNAYKWLQNNPQGTSIPLRELKPGEIKTLRDYAFFKNLNFINGLSPTALPVFFGLLIFGVITFMVNVSAILSSTKKSLGLDYYEIIKLSAVISGLLSLVMYSKGKYYLDLRSPVFEIIGIPIYNTAITKFNDESYEIKDVKIYRSKRPEYFKLIRDSSPNQAFRIEYSPHSKLVWSLEKYKENT